jgi:hypothetical protein
VKRAAQIALRVLSRTAVENIPVENALTVPTFD